MLLFAAIATVASCLARDGVRGTAHTVEGTWNEARMRLDSLPAMPSPLPLRPFWIGAWVGPPVGALADSTWRTFSAAGIDVSMLPLEDAYRRADNAARLSVLDTLGHLRDSLFTFVRDDSLHPDETSRPGWERRVETIVRAYSGSRALAGYFLADEPRAGDLAGWAPAARLLRRLDPAHPAYVNFAGLSPSDATDPAARARWRTEVSTAVVEGELPFFTVDAYPFVTGEDERGNFLATLREAARVSHATRRPFGVVLQFTGHANVRAVTPAEASYQAMQALAHGAACVIWFTYWTPDPQEEHWRWHGGAIDYDGTPNARIGILSELNPRLRRMAGWRGAAPLLVAHRGPLPSGLAADSIATVPGLDSLATGAFSIGFSARAADGERRYVLVQRDRDAAATCRVRFAAHVDSARILDGGSAIVRGPGPALDVPLGPGGGAVIATWSSAPPPDRHPPRRSGKRP